MEKTTGIELIAQERKEQIEKHGYTVKSDKQYKNDELGTLVKWILTELDDAEKDNYEEYLFTDEDGCKFPLSLRDKILSKPPAEQLAVAGALIAAKIDLL